MIALGGLAGLAFPTSGLPSKFSHALGAVWVDLSCTSPPPTCLRLTRFFFCRTPASRPVSSILFSLPCFPRFHANIVRAFTPVPVSSSHLLPVNSPLPDLAAPRQLPLASSSQLRRPTALLFDSQPGESIIRAQSCSSPICCSTAALPATPLRLSIANPSTYSRAPPLDRPLVNWHPASCSLDTDLALAVSSPVQQ